MTFLDDPYPAAKASAQPRVSVIVPIYNGASDLPALLESLNRQTYPTDRVEYLLVDNNSRDHTVALLQQWVQASASPLSRWRILSETTIQSSYAARNAGIQAAVGDILVFTDVDCRPQPDWLQRLIAPFQDQSIGLVAGEITGLPGKTVWEQYAERQATLSQRHTVAHPFCPYGQTANLAIRRTALMAVGLFRPYLTTGGDADICWRILQQTRWRLEFAADALVAHRHRSTLRALQQQWRRYGRSNKYLHELYGTELMPQLQPREVVYRLIRWAVKEFPLTLWQLLRGQAQPIDLVTTPIHLLCVQARTAGQRSAHLSVAARAIVPWNTTAVAPCPDSSG